MALLFRIYRQLSPQANVAAALPGLSVQQNRQLFRWLDVVFNRPDEARIKEVGPDRACAEWLLRCGAHVRWMDADHFVKDYNTLSPSKPSSYKIEEIKAVNAALIDVGFRHFVGCAHIRKIHFHRCHYLDDGCLPLLGHLKDSLHHLLICSCLNVTDAGISSLSRLHQLEKLTLMDLPMLKNRSQVINDLVTALPDCEISYKDLEPANTDAGST